MKPVYLVLTCLAGCVAASAADAGVIAMPPSGPARVANADAVLVGKVEAVEPADVKVGNVNYRIAVVKIADGVRGVKEGVKTVRIGFTPIEKPNPMVFVSGPRPIQLEVGQGGLFLLTKQTKDNANFYVIGGIVGYYINSDKNPNFDKEVQAAKAAVKVMGDPLAALKAKDVDERLLAAALLIERHRTFRGPKSSEEPIDAAESKLILKTLAEADWKTDGNFMSMRPAPAQLFQKLGVTKKDGFAVGKVANYQEEARAWLRTNAGTYRIQRFTEGKKD